MLVHIWHPLAMYRYLITFSIQSRTRDRERTYIWTFWHNLICIKSPRSYIKLTFKLKKKRLTYRRKRERYHSHCLVFAEYSRRQKTLLLLEKTLNLTLEINVWTNLVSSERQANCWCHNFRRISSILFLLALHYLSGPQKARQCISPGGLMHEQTWLPGRVLFRLSFLSYSGLGEYYFQRSDKATLSE